jgi:hypothetical protein
VVEALTLVCQEVGAEVQQIWTRRLLNSWWEELSPTVRAAIGAADVVIQNLSTIGKTHMLDLMLGKGTRRIRNYATDVMVMSSDWARFPVEVQDLVEIKVNTLLHEGKKYRITSPAGTDIQGDISQSIRAWRKDTKRSGGLNISFPPSVFRAMESLDASGVIMVEGTYPWGARRWGLPEMGFEHPVKLTVQNNHVVHVEGGWEADRFKFALEETAAAIGERAYEIDSWHSGMSPRAFAPFYPMVDPDRWDHLVHSHEGWLHFHIGGISVKNYSDKNQKAEHVNAVCRDGSLYVDGEKVITNGRLYIWDDPEVKALAEKYGGASNLFVARPIMR